MLDDSEIKFAHACKKIFNTPSGRVVLKRLKEDHVDISALNSDPYKTHYLLGQKELIQGLIQYIKNPDILEEEQ